jgi:preprotein translocase subunit SecG
MLWDIGINSISKVYSKWTAKKKNEGEKLKLGKLLGIAAVIFLIIGFFLGYMIGKDIWS